MPRQLVYFDQEVLDRLKKHIRDKYGKRRALSAVVQFAVEEYLKEEESKNAKRK